MTEKNKPEWQKEAEEKMQLLDGGLFKQIAYISTPDNPCGVVALTTTLTHNVNPIVVEAPAGLQSPVYDWVKQKWTERDTSALSEKLTDVAKQVTLMSDDVDKVKQDQASAQDTNGEILKSLKEVQASQSQTTAMMGQFMTMLQGMSKPSEEATDKKEGQE